MTIYNISYIDSGTGGEHSFQFSHQGEITDVAVKSIINAHHMEDNIQFNFTTMAFVRLPNTNIYSFIFAETIDYFGDICTTGYITRE